jgi:hypothetical protein
MATAQESDEKKTSVPPAPNLEQNLSTEWQTIAKQLKAEDEAQLKTALEDAQAQTTAVELETEITKVIMPLCINKLDHPIFEIRALALNVIASQLRAENWALEHLVPDLVQQLAKQNLFDVKSYESSDIYIEFHKDLLYTIGDVHNRHPSKLVPVFKRVVNYLVEATDSSNREIATLACMFWGNLKEPPVSEKLMEQWKAPFSQKLNELVLALTKCKIYHPDYLKY